MKNFKTLKFEVNDGVARLILNRPEKHNAINALMIRELRQAASIIVAASEIRVVILAAQGSTFCAGGDLHWMKEQASIDREGKIKESSQLALMLQDLDQLPKPLIARIQGSAYGGGIGMISVCDIAIAVDDCKFGLTETRLGLIPATIGPYVVRCLGEANARQVFMNAKLFDSNRAEKLGLLSSVVSADELDQAIDIEVDAFFKCAPGAVADAKALCQHVARSEAKDLVNYSAHKLADRWETQEAQHGIGAFFDREKPPWTK